MISLRQVSHHRRRHFFIERFFNYLVQTWFQSCTPECTNSLAFFPVIDGYTIDPIINPRQDNVLLVIVQNKSNSMECAQYITKKRRGRCQKEICKEFELLF